MPNKISGLLIRYRLCCGFTQQMVANTLKVDRSTYSYYETGKSNPSLKTILILKKLLNIPYDELLRCFDSEIEAEVSSKTIEPENDKIILFQKDELPYPLSVDERQLLLYYRKLGKKEKAAFAKKFK